MYISAGQVIDLRHKDVYARGTAVFAALPATLMTGPQLQPWIWRASFPGVGGIA